MQYHYWTLETRDSRGSAFVVMLSLPKHLAEEGGALATD